MDRWIDGYVYICISRPARLPRVFRGARARRRGAAWMCATCTCRCARIQATLQNVRWFRGGPVFKAHRLVYHSTLGRWKSNTSFDTRSSAESLPRCAGAKARSRVDVWMWYLQRFRFRRRVELRPNRESISHRCHLFEVAFVWELT